MKQDTDYTDVIFRVDTTKDFKGTVFALMPHECCDEKGHVTSYQHIGQHSAANYAYCIRDSKPAKEHDYTHLKAEMEDIGYFVKVVKKQNYKKYWKSFRLQLNICVPGLG